MQSGVSLAYLLSQYPAINHAFMLREVRRLRELGFEVQVASVSPPDRPFDRLTPLEQQEAQSTFYIKTCGLRTIFQAHLATVFSRPAAYRRGLTWSLRPGRLGIPYFVVAAMP